MRSILDPKFVNNTESFKSLSLIEQKRQLPDNNEVNQIRLRLQSQLTMILENDHESRCVLMAEEMEVAGISGNSQRMFALIGDTSGRGIR